MDHTLIEYLKNFQILSKTELDKLFNKTCLRTIKKGDFLIREGSVCKEIAFIKSGILRSFYVNAGGIEITNCLTFENELMSAFSSFITQKPTDENIQALVDTEVEVLTKNILEELYANSIQWQKLGRLLAEMQFVQLEQRSVSFQKHSAQLRYENLLKNRSHYLKYIPLQYLATYLGITPRHLSRLRRK